MKKRARAMLRTVNGRLGQILRGTQSEEWKHAVGLTLIWLQVYDRDTVSRTARKLADRYHLHPTFQREQFERLGLDYTAMRQRYAAWKEIRNLLENDYIK